MRRVIISMLMVMLANWAFATVYYVSTTGNDSGNGSAASPWRTLRAAVSKVPANQGHVIKLAAGTYVEAGGVVVPAGVSIDGAGMDVTILKAASSFYYNPTTPGYATDKYLIQLGAASEIAGNQTLTNFTIDGDGKKVHGGIFVQNRNNVRIENVKVQYVNFNGIWVWQVKDVVMKNIRTLNCSWGSAGWCAGAVQIGTPAERVELTNSDINEDTGYGIKSLGGPGLAPMKDVKVHDTRVSVAPNGKWNNGSAPNISIEFWANTFPGTEIYNCYIDNFVSLVNTTNGTPATGQKFKIHHNTFDMLGGRSGGGGYAMELAINDAEVYNNWFNGGSNGIVNWGHQATNWDIHHNHFYRIANTYPTGIICSYKSGVNNVNIYNNTIEMVGTSTTNVFTVNNGGVAANVNIKNNLIINNNTSYAYYPNKLIDLLAGATVKGLSVTNNALINIPAGSVPGNYANNITSGDMKIAKTGNRPTPYYVPQAGSPLIGAGVNVGLPFTGSAPTIGASEAGGGAPVVKVTGVTVAPATSTLEVDATVQMTRTIAPTNASNQGVTWTTSNSSIASVDGNGLVRAVAAGTATITATTIDGGLKASGTITVNAPKPVAVTDVTLTVPSTTLSTGATATLTPVIVPANATNKAVMYTSSNTAVATVSATGVVSALTAGSTTITVKTVDGAKTASATLSVVQATSFELDDATIGTAANQFNYTGAWTHGTTTTDPFKNNTCSYSNTANNTVTLSFAGNRVELYTAKAPTHGIVAVSVDGGAETMVDLYAASRQNDVMVFGSAALASGNHTVRIRVTGSKNAAASSNYVVIDYMKVYNNVTTVAVTGVSVAPATLALSVGATSPLTVTITPANATNKSVTWSSSNAAVATVSTTGVVTALTTGSATITATSVDGGKTSTSSVAVTVNVPVTGVTLSATTAQIMVGEKYNLTATVVPATATNKNVTWTSSNAGLATVSATGEVTAVASGTVTVTAKSVEGAKVATCTIAISPKPVTADLDNATQGTGKNQFNYTGSWTHGLSNTDPYLNNTCSYSNVANNTVTVSFTGNKVELYTAKASHHGIVAVSIDNGAETLVDLYSATRQNFVMVYTSGIITEGDHTIKMRVTGSKNPAATAGYVVIDYIKIYSSPAVAAATLMETSAATEGPADLTANVSVYPNPVVGGDVLHVTVPAATGDVRLIDITGNALRTVPATDTAVNIDTNGIMKGVYFIQYRSDAGQSMNRILIQ